MSSSTLDVLAALCLPGVGPGKVRQALTQSTSFDVGLELVRARASEAALEKARQSAHEIALRCGGLGIQPVSVLDNEYPARLRKISDFPPVIYVKGSVSVLSLPAVAVVGTRHPSDLGLSYARKTAIALCEGGIAVVSGLALGIDTAAHVGALLTGGKTVAVLAHGLDSISPSSNKSLAEEIVSSGGALVAEHPPGIRAYAPEFVRRNRIQSGLSLASIMVESGEEGGSIHQARFTATQRRRLYAMVPRIDLGEQYGFKYAGAYVIEREFGAKRISSKEDVERIASELIADLG